MDDSDPSKRWIARYEREADLKKSEIDGAVRPIGAFGTNENGSLDVAGNVWEWTNTCFVRTALHEAGKAVSTTANCGVRVVEGQHRAYVTDFIRDARAGGCAAGVPPSNLGFRLVRESTQIHADGSAFSVRTGLGRVLNHDRGHPLNARPLRLHRRPEKRTCPGSPGRANKRALILLDHFIHAHPASDACRSEVP